MAIKLIKSSFYNEQEEKEKLCEFIKDSQHEGHTLRHCQSLQH